jgi:hypothetical protein
MKTKKIFENLNCKNMSTECEHEEQGEEINEIMLENAAISVNI